MSAKTLHIVCTTPGFGGLELNTLKLAHWLRDFGWHSRLLLLGGSPMHRAAVEQGLEAATVQQYGGTRWASGSILQRWAGKGRCLLFTPYNKDIAALSGYKRFRNKQARLVYQQHMMVGVRKKDIFHTLRYQMLDRWISPLELLKSETLQKTRVSEAKIAVIPFGLETGPFLEPGISRAEARHNLQLPPEAPLLGVLGRIDPKKGQDTVIRALAQLQDTPWQLLIMGSETPGEGDAYLRSLHALCAEHGLQERLHFRPYEADVRQFYRAVDVFVMPSHCETFGMVTLEAMASGVPVIGTDAGGTAELLRQGQLGQLFEPCNAEALSRQIRLLDPAQPPAARIAAARQEVLRHYDRLVMCRRMDALLSALL